MMPDAEPIVEAEDKGGDPAVIDAPEPRASSESDTTDVVEVETAPAGQRPGGVPGRLEPTPFSPAAGRHDPLRRIGAIAFISTVLLVAGAVTLTRSPFFYASTIEVEGMSHVARADVLRIAAITPKTNVFTLDAGAAEARLERDPWIAEATITKDLPSRLVIDIHERVAVAVVTSGGVLRLVADDGALLEAALPRMAMGLPVIALTEEGVEPAADVVEGAARTVAAMAPTLRHRIDGVSILADGQLRVDLMSGAEVAYGEAIDLSDKAMALRALLDYAAERGASVISADVRVPSAPTAVLAGGVVVTP
jgi:cell division protein FtsQ